MDLQLGFSYVITYIIAYVTTRVITYVIAYAITYIITYHITYVMTYDIIYVITYVIACIVTYVIAYPYAWTVNFDMRFEMQLRTYQPPIPNTSQTSAWSYKYNGRWMGKTGSSPTGIGKTFGRLNG